MTSTESVTAGMEGLKSVVENLKNIVLHRELNSDPWTGSTVSLQVKQQQELELDWSKSLVTKNRHDELF